MICIISLIGIITLLLYFRFIKKNKIVTIINQNTTILLTGGCMGIGKQLVQLLLKRNCKIIVIDIRNDIIKDNNITFYKCDLSNQQQLQSTLSLIQKNHKQIDILINNAAIAKTKFFIDETLEDIIQTNQINYLAPVFISKWIVPIMLEQGNGHLVNIASVMSILPGLKAEAYIASKHALFGFHNCLRAELKQMKAPIKTTIILPWAINTGMFQGFQAKMSFLLPMLSEEQVAKEIIYAIEYGKEVMSIRRFMLFLCHLFRFIPSYIMDQIVIYNQQDFLQQLIGRK